MNRKQSVTVISAATFGLMLALGACSKKSDEAAPAPAPTSAPAETPAASSDAAPTTAADAAAVPAAARTKAPDGAKESFVGIKDGDTVSSPFKVGFQIDGMKLAPAGTPDAGVGHHHLIIDSELPPQTAALPETDQIKHYGKAQTETEVTLPAGKHTLQLEFADSNHVPFDPPVVSDKITVTVK